MRNAALFLLTLLLTPPGQRQDFFPKTISLTGELTRDDYERVFERPFDVPAGTRRIEVSYSVTGADRRTVMDLGLRGPAGLRGWSGGSKSAVFVSALGATPGYLPGPIETGAWAVLLGVPNIRTGSRDRYTITIRLLDTDLEPSTRVIRPGLAWYAGDLHAHSGHSDGRSKSRAGAAIPTPPHRVFDAAAAAGLDFVLLSDHNTASHWLDVDRLQPQYDDLLLLHGREVTTYRGHANTVGEFAFHDFRLPQPLASPAALLEGIHRSGAFISINHPQRPDDESCMGCGWNVTDAAVMRQVDGVEVINGTTRSGPMAGWGFWAARLNEGARLTAVGGSDEHSVDAREDQNVGVPATMVYARELSEPAIVDGLKSGRVYVRADGVRGPRLEFWAQRDGHRYEMGSAIPGSGDLTLHAEIAGADGQSVEWIRNGLVVMTTAAGPAPLTQVMTARGGDWFSLVIRQGDQPTVVSNAITVSR